MEGLNRIALTGELTIYRAQELKERISPLLTVKGAVEIDLASVTELDTAGVQILLLAKRELGNRLHLVHHSQAALDVIDLYGLVPHFGDPVLMSGTSGGFA